MASPKNKSKEIEKLDFAQEIFLNEKNENEKKLWETMDEGRNYFLSIMRMFDKV